MSQRDPFECWYSVADVAARFDVTSKTVSRWIAADEGLREAARQIEGRTWLPWSAWEFWLNKPERLFTQREVVERNGHGHFASAGVSGRTEGEVRRRLQSEQARKEAIGE